MNVILEKLSPEDYLFRSIPGFKEYYLVEQDKCLVTQCIRNSKGNWEMIDHDSMQKTFSIDCVGVELKNSEVYQGVLI